MTNVTYSHGYTFCAIPEHRSNDILYVLTTGQLFLNKPINDVTVEFLNVRDEDKWDLSQKLFVHGCSSIFQKPF